MTDSHKQLELFPDKEYEVGTCASVEKRLALFGEFPYHSAPFKSRNWGHALHSLCSYQSKLKPAIAHFLVRYFSCPGEVVLDPFSGVGTIPFEACLQGRVGIANDINPVAFHNSNAKVSFPDLSDIEAVLGELEAYLRECPAGKEELNGVRLRNINGNIHEYFHERTFGEIVAARRFFRNGKCVSAAYSLVFACLLHILHGNRPYALSRRSHGITPFAPSGEYVYKPLLQHLRQKVRRSLGYTLPSRYRPGRAFQASVMALPDLGCKVDVIITSPPFLNSTRFYLANWLRLWFCGWEDEDFRSSQRGDYLEEAQARSMGIYRSVFNVLRGVIKPGGLCILHLGVVKGRDMAEIIRPFAEPCGFETAALLYESVEGCERHGVRDQGGTGKHQFLFLRRG